MPHRTLILHTSPDKPLSGRTPPCWEERLISEAKVGSAMAADRSAIEWTEATWNPVTGCSKVSPGCAHCYAETLSLRFSWSEHSWTPAHAEENVVLHPRRLDQPLRWRRPRTVFVNSMSDLFHELVPLEFIADVFAVM